MVRPLRVCWPLLAVTISVAAPMLSDGILTVICRSLQETMGANSWWSSGPSIVTLLFGPRTPKPVPVIVNCLLSSLLRMYGRDTANSCGVVVSGLQSTGAGWAEPGAIATEATWVGAVSVVVNSPGQAWKLVPMLRYLGL